MKKIEAIIRPERFMAVSSMLQEMGIKGMLVTEVMGHGNENNRMRVWRGRKYMVALHKKIKLEIVVSEAELESAIKIIIEEAKTGAIGDGKVFVTHVESARRIRTGETGESAITVNGRVVRLSPKEPEDDMRAVGHFKKGDTSLSGVFSK